ncbi:MAG: hypothetical protein ACJ76H_03060 [Bacteriovoracaceae bacterium]
MSSHFVSAHPVEWNDVKFSIDVPANWREVKDFYGIPVTLLGPSVSPKPRAVVQIIPTDISPEPMSETDAKAFGEKYSEGRKKWVAEQEGELLELLPGKFENGRLVAGVSYKLNQKSYLERTYYVNCKKRLFHLKIVLNFENRDELSQSESIVRSFQCAD